MLMRRLSTYLERFEGSEGVEGDACLVARRIEEYEAREGDGLSSNSKRRRNEAPKGILKDLKCGPSPSSSLRYFGIPSPCYFLVTPPSWHSLASIGSLFPASG